MAVIMAKMAYNGKNGGRQAFHDFWGWQNFSSPRAPMTRATTLTADSLYCLIARKL